MGQALSMLICGTAVTCQYLADAGVETPMLQSFLNYALLLLTYTLVLAFRRGTLQHTFPASNHSLTAFVRCLEGQNNVTITIFTIALPQILNKRI